MQRVIFKFLLKFNVAFSWAFLFRLLVLLLIISFSFWKQLNTKSSTWLQSTVVVFNSKLDITIFIHLFLSDTFLMFIGNKNRFVFLNNFLILTIWVPLLCIAERFVHFHFHWKYSHHFWQKHRSIWLVHCLICLNIISLRWFLWTCYTANRIIPYQAKTWNVKTCVRMTSTLSNAFI